MPLGFDVYAQISRPDPDLVEALRTIPTADLSDVMFKHGAMNHGIRPLYAPMEPYAGPAITVAVPNGAFEMVKVAINTAQAGDVLVVNARSNTQHALLGGNVCRGMQARGLAGMVADGVVRDELEIQEDGFPIHCLGTAIVMGSIQGTGEVNVPIACGGAVVNPGDIIVADAEGVVAIPAADAEEILAKARALHERHVAIQPVLLRGEVTDITNILRRVGDQGAAFHDDSWS